MEKPVFSLILTFSLITAAIAQDPPGMPVIDWMSAEYQLQGEPLELNVSWNMWWGINGDNWQLTVNDVVVFSADILPDSPNAQQGNAVLTISEPGQYSLVVNLCIGPDNCTSSAPVAITVTGYAEAPDHGEGAVHWGQRVFAPYTDVTSWPGLSLTEYADSTGVNRFVLGFIVDHTGSACEPSWGTYYDLNGQAYGTDLMLGIIANNEIGQLRENGGDIMPSVGGAANFPLAAACSNVFDLADAYMEIISTLNLTHLDFDIEGFWVADPASVQRRSEAISILQEQLEMMNSPVDIWYTLPVLPTGLTADGLAVIESALEWGVSLAGINIMAMDYGDNAAPDPENQMGEYAVQAAQSLHAQLTDCYTNAGFNYSSEEIWQKIGVTPMIGMNDVQSEIFNQTDAQELMDFGSSVNLRMLSMWSANRDQECPGGEVNYVSPSCSSILQSPGEFGSLFSGYNSAQEDPAGDMNLDGSLDILDAVLMISYILDGEYFAGGDINDDGVLNILDATLLVALILEID